MEIVTKQKRNLESPPTPVIKYEHCGKHSSHSELTELPSIYLSSKIAQSFVSPQAERAMFNIKSAPRRQPVSWESYAAIIT